jgi:hypothetical protein
MWGSAIPYTPSDGAVLEDDQTGTEAMAPGTNGQAMQEEEAVEAPPPPRPAGKGPAKQANKSKYPPAEAPPPPVEEPGEEEAVAPGEEDLEGDTLEELVAKADGKDLAARERLITLAEASGYTRDEALGADTWADIAAMIEAPRSGEEGEVEVTPPEEEAEEGPAAPKKGQVWAFRPPVKNKEGKWVAGKKQIRCMVQTVDEENQTFDLKSLEDNKTVYKRVKWTSAEPVS